MKIVVIGTGQMGTSILLAANRADIDCVGYDQNPDVRAEAAKIIGTENARIADTIEDAVKDADIVIRPDDCCPNCPIIDSFRFKVNGNLYNKSEHEILSPSDYGYVINAT